MDKKLKRNLIIVVAVLIVFFIGIIGLAQYGAQSTKNNSTVTLNAVAGVDNVTLPNTFQATNTAEGLIKSGNDSYHDELGDVILWYSKTKTKILFLNQTDSIKHMPTTNVNKAEKSMGINRQNKTIAGITGIVETNPTTNTTFYFVINNKTYMIEYEVGGDEGVSILLEAWLKASGYKQNVENLSASTTTESATTSSSKSTSKVLKEGEEAPYHEGWTKDDYIAHGYKFSNPNGVG